MPCRMAITRTSMLLLARMLYFVFMVVETAQGLVTLYLTLWWLAYQALRIIMLLDGQEFTITITMAITAISGSSSLCHINAEH